MPARIGFVELPYLFASLRRVLLILHLHHEVRARIWEDARWIHRVGQVPEGIERIHVLYGVAFK